jgi:two-component system chemotaxis response regulator CheY
MALNVLVVDDSAVMRAVVIKTLRLSGLSIGEVYQAANGRDALQTIANNWIDLALVDINMPEMNGMELIAAVRADPAMSSLAIVVVSTEGSDTQIASIREMGAEFVHKPFAPEVLREKIIHMMHEMVGVTNDCQHTIGALSNSSLDF